MRRIFPMVHYIKDEAGEHPLRLEILLERVERLILHEETIPENLEELREAFRRSSFFWHPIIVDRNTRVVLDGMHRVASLREMGYRYIPILTIDAMDPHVRLERWIRCYEGGRVNLPGIMREAGFHPVVERRGKGADLIQMATQEPLVEGTFKVVDFEKGALYRVELKKRDPVEMYSEIRVLQRRLEEVLGETRYTTEHSLMEDKYSMKYSVIVVPPRISKKEVFDVSQRGEVFCPKATRFVLPVRVMFVNTPIYLLEEGDMSYEERNQIHYLILRQRRLFKIEGNVDIDRRYEEPYLYLFE